MSFGSKSTFRQIIMLRIVDRFVDLSELRRHLAGFYSSTGRPSVDPELMIRMLLVGYCYGIRSRYQRLCEEVHLNLAYRWFFCGVSKVWKARCRGPFDFLEEPPRPFQRGDAFGISSRQSWSGVSRRAWWAGKVSRSTPASSRPMPIVAAIPARTGTGSGTQPPFRAHFATSDDAAWGAATDVTPKFVSPSIRLPCRFRHLARTSPSSLIRQLSGRRAVSHHRRSAPRRHSPADRLRRMVDL